MAHFFHHQNPTKKHPSHPILMPQRALQAPLPLILVKATTLTPTKDTLLRLSLLRRSPPLLHQLPMMKFLTPLLLALKARVMFSIVRPLHQHPLMPLK
ncbi:hypothetical protein GOBAR_DD11016 [Gossypium barbadense]|nr:hypothetical protein GOBAR_DD11016 [Gossypium barbadense]